MTTTTLMILGIGVLAVISAAISLRRAIRESRRTPEVPRGRVKSPSFPVTPPVTAAQA